MLLNEVVPASLFSRVTKYFSAPSSNQQENRLTEITAAVLSEVEGLAFAFIHRMLETSAEEEGLDPAEVDRRMDRLKHFADLQDYRPSIRTQVYTGLGRFVDLEICFRPPPGKASIEFLAWVEIKHGTGPHSGQLQSYLASIRPRSGRNAAVLLLAPRSDLPFDSGVPSGVPWSSWQSVAKCVLDFRPVTETSSQAWLLRQYVDYLQEERLMDPDRLTVAHALSLMERTDAEHAVAHLCERADHLVLDGWNVRGDEYKGKGSKGSLPFGLGFWSHFPTTARSAPTSSSWGDGWFEYGLVSTEGLHLSEAPRGAWFFVAGATWPARGENPTKLSANADWESERLGEGFEHFKLGSHDRLMRVLYPDQLLSGSSLDQQGRELGEWIVEAFSDLADHPPPHSTRPL